jgi:hypothetical protein
LVAALELVFREEWGRVLATLIGFLGDFDLAEEAAQEAFAIAAERWPRDGVPRNPRAWLMTTARNQATDRIRRDRGLAAKFGLLVAGNRAEVPMKTTTFPDEIAWCRTRGGTDGHRCLPPQVAWWPWLQRRPGCRAADGVQATPHATCRRGRRSPRRDTLTGMKARFRRAMALMQRADPQVREDGFGMLRAHADDHLDDLMAEFHQQSDHGLRCWLLELIGEARDERALPLLADQINNPDEALRSWAASGLTKLDTRQARKLLYQARANGTIT